MCSKDTKQNVPESCGYNLTKRGICPCGTWLSFSCFNNPRETLADTLIQKLLQLLLSQPPSQVSKGRTKLLSHTCKELYSTDGSCGIRGCGRRGTSEGEKKKKLVRYTEPAVEDQQWGRSRSAPLEVGCNGFTTSTTNSLREWGIPG